MSKLIFEVVRKDEQEREIAREHGYHTGCQLVSEVSEIKAFITVRLIGSKRKDEFVAWLKDVSQLILNRIPTTDDGREYLVSLRMERTDSRDPWAVLKEVKEKLEALTSGYRQMLKEQDEMEREQTQGLNLPGYKLADIFGEGR
jgi:hypothetical protein